MGNWSEWERGLPGAALRESDPEIARLIEREIERQGEGLELIASENFVSPAVLEAMGTALTNKYAEGLPGKRYYGGCEFVDGVEQLAIDRAKQLFGADHANVQPHSGAQANGAVFLAFLKPGDVFLGMDLSNGVSSHVLRMRTPSSSLTNRAGSTSTFASLWRRASSAISGDHTTAARTCGCRFAAYDIPSPVPQSSTPRFTCPLETSSASGCA